MNCYIEQQKIKELEPASKYKNSYFSFKSQRFYYSELFCEKKQLNRFPVPFLTFTAWCGESLSIASIFGKQCFEFDCLFHPFYAHWISVLAFVLHSHPLNHLSGSMLRNGPHFDFQCMKQGNIRYLGAGYVGCWRQKPYKNEDVDGCVHYPATEQRVQKTNIKVSVVEIRLSQLARSKVI